MKKSLSRATDTFGELVAYYAIIITSSASLFSLFEHRKLVDSVWWAIVTATTVGYGDIYPVTVGGRITGVMLMHLVPMVLVPLIVVKMMGSLIEDKNQFTNEEQELVKKELIGIRKLLSNK